MTRLPLVPRPTLLALVLMALASGSACKSKDPGAATEPRRWKLEFDDGGAPIGAVVVYGDHEVGRVTAPQSYETQLEQLYVRGTVPAEFDGSRGSEDYAGFSIELRTPCGTERVPLTPVREEGRADPLLRFDPSKATATASTLVWTDVPKATIAIGEAEAAIAMDHYIVNGLDCGPKHAVVVNGEPAGELEAAGEALVGVWVAKDASTCYEVTVARFGEDGGRTTTSILSGARVYPFPHDRIDYRFKPVPESITVSLGTADTTRVGINVVDCAAAAPGSAPE